MAKPTLTDAIELLVQAENILLANGFRTLSRTVRDLVSHIEVIELQDRQALRLFREAKKGGDMEEAMRQASLLRDTDLRAQAYADIARVMMNRRVQGI